MHRLLFLNCFFASCHAGTKPDPVPPPSSLATSSASPPAPAQSNSSTANAPSSPIAPPILHKLRTDHIGKLIGSAQNPLDGTLGLLGTDLGVSFPRDGKL